MPWGARSRRGSSVAEKTIKREAARCTCGHRPAEHRKTAGCIHRHDYGYCPCAKYTPAPRVGPARSLVSDEPDPVNHPPHYTRHPSGVECIQITEHMNFNLGNAVKYIWRAGEKGKPLEDLRKARWYVEREIMRLTRAPKGGGT